MLCAHMDTVPLPPGTVTLVESDGVLRTDGSSILGSDDRAGIALALEMIDLCLEGAQHPPLEIVFTVQEELGVSGPHVCTGHCSVPGWRSTLMERLRLGPRSPRHPRKDVMRSPSMAFPAMPPWSHSWEGMRSGWLPGCCFSFLMDKWIRIQRRIPARLPVENKPMWCVIW